MNHDLYDSNDLLRRRKKKYSQSVKKFMQNTMFQQPCHITENAIYFVSYRVKLCKSSSRGTKCSSLSPTFTGACRYRSYAFVFLFSLLLSDSGVQSASDFLLFALFNLTYIYMCVPTMLTILSFFAAPL